MKNSIIKILSLFIMVLIGFFIAGCDDTNTKNYIPTYSDTPIKNKKQYIFGVHPLHNPKKLFEVYQPLVDYINKHIPEIEVRLEASRNYASYNKKLFSGHFDISLPNPYQTVQSLEHGYKVFGKMGDDINFRGIIITRKDSKINSIEDLKGKVVSYPAPTALAATMMPQYYLFEHGLDIKKDIKNIYVGSQESSIMSVYLKKSDAASTWPPPWVAFSKERPDIAKGLIVKWETKNLPNNGLVVKDNFPQELLDKISTLLFSLHQSKEGRDILSRMELSQFEAATKGTYEPVIAFLDTFEKKVRNIKDKK